MFEQAFIEATREAQGDEAARLLETANQRESHAARVERYRTDAELQTKYPRMIAAIRDNKIAIPVFPDDQSADAYMSQQELFLTSMGAPLPGEQPTAPTAPAQTLPPEATPPQVMDPALFGQRKGVIPWSADATQAATLRPIMPGPSPGESAIVVSEVEALMQPQPGEFTRARPRDFQLIKGMEIANSVPGGTQELRAMRETHEDPDMFTV